jgi:GNAT superfamily N-acetyltransferase
VPRLFEHPSDWRTPDELVDGTIRVLERALAAGQPDELFLIAEDAGEPIGFAYAVTQHDFFSGEPHAHLSEIVSVREGAGVGTVLLAAVERWAFARGDRYVSLNVLDRNARAGRFYERSGYEIETRKLIKLRDS